MLTAAHLDIPSAALGERIFSLQDWEFIATYTPAEIQRTFLQERKALALAWLRQTRETVGQLMRFYRKAVRGNAAISPAVEFRLALDFVLFLLAYESLCALIRVWGPFCARRMVGYAARTAEEMSSLSGQVLAGLDPAHLGRIQSNWSGGPQAP